MKQELTHYERLLKVLAHKERQRAVLQDSVDRINRELARARTEGKDIISKDFTLEVER